jgi:methionine-rich copper-binding protein CopC
VEHGKTVVQLLPPLPPGAYKAQWMSVGHDGHHVHGELTFTVK